MPEEKLLTVREVSLFLGVSEKEVIDLAESGAIPAYKVGGVYLRFKKEQVQGYKQSSHFAPSKVILAAPRSLKDSISDFFYFNDFYILCSLLILLLVVLIVQGF
jgi:excisionase family DNA binding protein